MVAMASCSEDDDIIDSENDEEQITRVTLTFTPTTGGDTKTAQWFDADGDGLDAPVIGDIVLAANTEYDLSITFENTLATEAAEQDITAEVEEEGAEHMVFFGWTDGLFSDPAGDGNIDNRVDDMEVNYDDADGNGQPLGLETSWTTDAAGSGKFTVLLAHQPGLKSGSSQSDDGESDVDITFDISIQ